ncbi:MAG: MmcB family DNA repair protein [Bauldia sp.]|nr:MmcB family DNA repair protein [Bauldia sp.]
MNLNISPAEMLRDGRQSAMATMIQKGVGRRLRAEGFFMLTELTLSSGRRADVVGLGPGGEIWIVEIKCSVEDFRADLKWEDYRAHCDRLFFATHAGVPAGIFPLDAGFILADAYGADVIRPAPEHRASPAARRSVTLRFAQAAAGRLHGIVDPFAAGTLL